MPTSAHAGYTDFTEICGEFATSQRADRVVGPYGKLSIPLCSVGADASVRPQIAAFFTEIFGEFVTSQWADVGIGPYSPKNRCAAGSPEMLCSPRLPAAPLSQLR